MTTPLIPDFVLSLFQNEIIRINSDLLKKTCDIYNIDFEDAKNKLKKELHITFQIKQNEKIAIVKKQKIVEPAERCIARVFRKKDIEVLQCTRRKKDCDFCKRHETMFNEKRLKYGTIHEEIPHEISPTVLNKIKKNKII